jgi:hypothetical protein
VKYKTISEVEKLTITFLKKFRIDVTTVDDVLGQISDSGLSSLGCIDITILKEKIIRIEFLNGKMDILRNIN